MINCDIIFCMLQTKFGREIAVILFIKLTLLYTLWNLCFKETKRIVTENEFANQVYGDSLKQNDQ